MTPNVIRSAKAIPSQLQKVVTAMFTESDQDLGRAVGDLRRSIRVVDDYVRSVDGAPAPAPVAKASAPAPAAKAPAAPAKRGRPPGRRGGRFATGDFIVKTLQSTPRGLRPRDIADKLEVAAKGSHSNALSTVNTTLGRLKQIGVARSNSGVWTLTGKRASKA